MLAFVAESLAELVAEPIAWLWEPYLPRGTLVVLDGDPGIGKSLLTVDLAARLSRGAPLPFRADSVPPQCTLLLNAEDDPAATTRPRAEAAGADLARLHVVGRPHGQLLALPDDFPELEALVSRHAPSLVVIDPITAFLGPDIAANAERGIRAVLGRLNGLAAGANCTVLLVRHLRKSAAAKAIHCGLGSIGLIASVRTALLAARHPADPTLGVLAATKTNLASEVPALGYRIAADARGRAIVEWTGPATVTADELVQRAEKPLRLRDRATAWLKAELSNGPRKSAELFAAAAVLGIPERTLERAKSALRVGSHRLWNRATNRGEWYWYDADAPWPTCAAFAKPFELPPLKPL